MASAGRARQSFYGNVFFPGHEDEVCTGVGKARHTAIGDEPPNAAFEDLFEQGFFVGGSRMFVKQVDRDLAEGFGRREREAAASGNVTTDTVSAILRWISVDAATTFRPRCT